MRTTLKLHPSNVRNINITSVQKDFLSLLVFTEISAIQINPVVPVKKSTLAEELWKTSKTGDDFDDLAMTRKIVLVWNRSKAPTKSAPLKEIRRAASRCPIVF